MSHVRSRVRLPRIILPEIAIPAVWLVFWWPVVSGREYPFIRDLVSFAEPMKAYMMARFSIWELPLWTPFVSAGMPFLADSSNQVFYPLNVVFFIFSSTLEALSWFLVLHNLLAMCALYWLCRAVALSRGISVWAGIVYGLAGYVLSITDNVNFLPTVVWVPAALAAHVNALSRKSSALSALTALCFAALILAGDVLSAGLLAGVMLLICAEVAARERAAGGGGLLAAASFPVLQLVIVIGLASMITAVQVLPTMEFYQVSARQAGLAYAESSQWSFPFARVIEFIQPFLFASNYPTYDFLGVGLYPGMGEPWANSVYLGTFTVVLGGIGAMARRRGAVVWLIVLAAALLMSFGANAPYHRTFVEALPLLGTQRYPEKLIYWVTLAACMLAAYGAQSILDAPGKYPTGWPRMSRPVKVAVSIALPLLAAWSLAYVPAKLWMWSGAQLHPHIWSMRLPATPSHIHVLMLHALVAFALLVGWLWLRPERRRAYLVALLVAGVVDLAWVHYRFVPTIPSGLIASQDAPYALRQFAPDQEGKGAYRMYFDVIAPGRNVNYEQGELAAKTFNALGESALDRGYVHVYAALFRRDRLQVNGGIDFGIEYLNGRMSPLQPAAHVAMEEYLLARNSSRLMALCNVRYVVTSVRPENPTWNDTGFTLRHADAERNLRIFEVDNYLPRALIVPRAVGSANDGEATLRALLAVDQPERMLVISTGLEPQEVAGSDAMRTTRPITLSHASPEVYEVAGHNPYEHAYLLVNESYLAGWSASLNGAPAELLQANERFMAVALGPGAFDVTLRYESTYLLTGAMITLCGLAVCAWLIAGVRLPRRALRRRDVE